MPIAGQDGIDDWIAPAQARSAADGPDDWMAPADAPRDPYRVLAIIHAEPATCDAPAFDTEDEP